MSDHTEPIQELDLVALVGDLEVDGLRAGQTGTVDREQRVRCGAREVFCRTFAAGARQSLRVVAECQAADKAGRSVNAQDLLCYLCLWSGKSPEPKSKAVRKTFAVLGLRAGDDERATWKQRAEAASQYQDIPHYRCCDGVEMLECSPNRCRLSDSE